MFGRKKPPAEPPAPKPPAPTQQPAAEKPPAAAPPVAEQPAVMDEPAAAPEPAATMADRARSVAADAPAPSAPAHPAPAAKPAVSPLMPALGEACAILCRSHRRHAVTMADVAWLLLPPLKAGQWRIYRDETGAGVGLLLWALLSEDAENAYVAKLLAGTQAKLTAEEWTGGDRPWLIEAVAVESAAEGDADKAGKVVRAMIGDLVQNVFPGRQIKTLVTDRRTGERRVATVGA